MEKNQEDVPMTLTQQQLTEFIGALRDTLVQAIVENNTQAMDALFQGVFPPFMERLEQIAHAQITLANALKTNRRDLFAMEFSRLLIERALRTEEGIDVVTINTIPAQAYALADEMDLHGRVAEVQAQNKGEMMDEHASKAKPGMNPKTLVAEFFGRKATPIGKAEIKTVGGGKKKH